MSKRILWAAVLIAAVTAVVLLLMHRQPKKVAMIIKNAAMYTVNPAQPKAEAVAVTNGIIMGVGTTADILARFEADTVIDLKGKPMYPGFIDSHAHLEGLGSLLVIVDVGNCSMKEIRERVAAEVSHHHDGTWLRGRGWDQNLWEGRQFPTCADLDGVAPDVPVVLERIDGHAVWLNSAALRRTGISASTPDPVGGRIVRDRRGNPSGVLVDNAINFLTAVLPPPSRTERRDAVQRAIQMCLRAGLTQVHDMGADSTLIEVYRELEREGRFPFRVYVALDGTKDTWRKSLESGPAQADPAGRVTVRALKMYMDGALGSRGAALMAPYADDPGNRGLTMMSADSLKSVALLCLTHGFQLCVHAIGDRANAIVLSAYEDAFKSRRVNGNDVRFRIEHAQVLDPADVKRFHLLGVIPMMQPGHCTSDFAWAEDRLGAQRAAYAYAWRSLIDDGNIVPAGSDFPVESPNPLLGFYAAISRQDLHGEPPGGWHPEQRMTREEALKAYTIWASYAAFEENVKGSIEPGKWADFVVLSEDIMTVSPIRIPDVRVMKTIVGGSIVYEAADSSLTEGE